MSSVPHSLLAAGKRERQQTVLGLREFAVLKELKENRGGTKPQLQEVLSKEK